MAALNSFHDAAYEHNPPAAVWLLLLSCFLTRCDAFCSRAATVFDPADTPAGSLRPPLA